MYKRIKLTFIQNYKHKIHTYVHAVNIIEEAGIIKNERLGEETYG